MARASANGITIEYDTFGDDANPPILLIYGVAGQMILWPEAFCKALSGRGFFVIRYDHRDVGLSTKFDKAGVPDIPKALAAKMRGDRIEDPPYTLDDMARDAAGLLDALNIKKAHVCGISMGGMIAQIMAIRFPEKLGSLTSIMSTTGDPDLPSGEPGALAALSARPPENREEYVENSLKIQRIFAGNGFKPDDALVKRQAERAFDRSFYPQGAARHFMAILAAENRQKVLGEVKTPTLVIHGGSDPLIPCEHGVATAQAIQGAQLIILKEMGHGIACSKLWPRIIDAVAEHVRKAEKLIH